MPDAVLSTERNIPPGCAADGRVAAVCRGPAHPDAGPPSVCSSPHQSKPDIEPFLIPLI